MDKTQKRSLAIIFLTVLLDLVGFGIILPLIPFLGREFSATGTEIGILMALYSLMQFLFAPFWGKLSDKLGRRPIMLVSILGVAVSYVIFAFATDLVTLYLSRAAAGFFAANISTAQAYIADITPKEKRSVGMGLIGAAFGLGFIMGPAIGAFTAGIGESLGDVPPFGMQFSMIVAAGLSLVNFIFAYFYLPETLDQKRAMSTPDKKSLQEFISVFGDAKLSPLVLIFLLTNLAMALMEVMMFLFVAERFGWGHQTAAYAFTYIGIIMVLTQGYFIRKWIPRFGEKPVLMVGLVMMAVSLFAIGLTYTVIVLAIIMTILAVGNGCVRPPILGITSVVADEEEQGFVMGIMQSMAAVGRILGPPLGGWLYENVSQGAPFYGSGVLAGVAALLFLLIYTRLPNPQEKMA